MCYYLKADNKQYPGVAQMVACLNGVQEAAGSTPVTRTKGKSFKDLPLIFYKYFWGVAQNCANFAFGKPVCRKTCSLLHTGGFV